MRDRVRVLYLHTFILTYLLTHLEGVVEVSEAALHLVRVRVRVRVRLGLRLELGLGLGLGLGLDLS